MAKQTSDFRYNTGATRVPWAAVGENYNVHDLMEIIRFLMQGEGKEYDDAIAAVWEQVQKLDAVSTAPGKLSLGSKVAAAEEACNEYLGTTTSTFVANATAGFEIAYKYANLKAGDEVIVPAITFVATILLWCLGKDMTGISANAVAMLPILVFCTTGIIKRRDLEEINWSVLWMVAGGFALGLALQKTGLAKVLIDNIPFGALNPVALLVVAGLLCWALSNFISNTATAALLIPILAVVAEASPALEAIGGSRTLLVGVAMAASFAMCLPISTPPNALAHSTGLIEQKHMVRVGVIVGIVGMTLGYGMLIAMSMF